MFDNNNDNEIVMMAETAVSQKTEKMVEYIRSLKTLEDAMEPYKEQKRELREEFKRQGWLTKDELSTTVKAYRMMKKMLTWSNSSNSTRRFLSAQGGVSNDDRVCSRSGGRKTS